MTVQPVTLNVPLPLYNRIKQRADQARRSVEAELLETVAVAMPVADQEQRDWAEVMASLTLLDDDTLWRAARNGFPTEKVAELEALHFKRQEQGLSEAEERTAVELTRQFDRAMSVRAQATALLMQRGYDVSSLLQPDE